VTSDLDFARELCGDAALYAPPRDAEAMARTILDLARSPALAERLVAAGQARLSRAYPAPGVKFAQQLALLEKMAAAR